MLESIIKRLPDPRLCDHPNPLFLAAFRVLFAASGLMHAVGSWEVRELVHAEYPQALIGAMHGIWFGFLVLLLVGFWSRTLAILHYLLALALLGFMVPIFTVELLLYLMASFWLIFIRPDEALSLRSAIPRLRHSARQASWPVYLFGLHLGFVLMSAGLCKIADPAWLEGLGLYYFVMLPYIKPAAFDFILEWKRTLSFMNYATLAFETLSPFLFFWFRTRLWITLVMTLFFTSLVLPIRIDFIGWLGVSCCLALMSISRFPSSGAGASSIQARSGLRVACAVAFTFLLLANLRPFAGARVPKALRFINDRVLFAYKIDLFTSKHLKDVYAIRVIARLENGEAREPIVIFTEDKSGGPHTLGLVPRYLQDYMYPAGTVSRTLAENPRSAIRPNHKRLMRSLLVFVLSRLAEEDRMLVESVSIHAGRIDLPEAYEGNVKPWLSSGWMELYRFEPGPDRWTLMGQ